MNLMIASFPEKGNIYLGSVFVNSHSSKEPGRVVYGFNWQANL